MARQYYLGRGWLSKLGKNEDIFHRRLEDIEGDMSPLSGQYGRVVQVLRRNWLDAVRHGCVFRTLKIAARLRAYRRQNRWEQP